MEPNTLIGDRPACQACKSTVQLECMTYAIFKLYCCQAAIPINMMRLRIDWFNAVRTIGIESGSISIGSVGTYAHEPDSSHTEGSSSMNVSNTFPSGCRKGALLCRHVGKTFPYYI